MKDRATDLRAIYETLRAKLDDADPSAAARVAAQLRIIGAELEQIEAPEEVSRVDELAAKRTRSGASRPPARRRKSG